jgi:hypothetical protein
LFSIWTINVFNSSESSRYSFYKPIISLAVIDSTMQTVLALKSNFCFFSSWKALKMQKQDPAFKLSNYIFSLFFKGTSTSTIPALRK